MKYLFIGGPWDQQWHHVPDGRPLVARAGVVSGQFRSVQLLDGAANPPVRVAGVFAYTVTDTPAGTLADRFPPCSQCRPGADHCEIRAAAGRVLPDPCAHGYGVHDSCPGCDYDDVAAVRDHLEG